MTYWELFAMLGGLAIGGWAYSDGGWGAVVGGGLGMILGFPLARFVGRHVTQALSRWGTHEHGPPGA